jgi:hypothetical protein
MISISLPAESIHSGFIDRLQSQIEGDGWKDGPTILFSAGAWTPAKHNTRHIWQVFRHNEIRHYLMICIARELSPDQKAAIEMLLGRRVQDGEAVSVRTFRPAALPHQRKMEIAGELRKYFAEVDVARQNISEPEAEAIITQAIRSARPGYHPHQ